MLYFNYLLGIDDYESFKKVREKIAPIRVMGDGNKTQPKRLIWKLVTSRELFKHRDDDYAKWYYDNLDLSLLYFENQSYCHAMKMSENKAVDDDCYNSTLHVCIDGTRYGVHPTYLLDERQGLCFDKDIKCIRHTNTETNRPDQKIKAGKWYRKMLRYSGFADMVPESWANHLCEIFANKWEAWAMASMPDVELVVDRDFESIYDRDKYTPDNDNFFSCMSSGEYGLGHHEFYEDCTPDAMAASIRDENGYILARCVLFNNVKDDDTGEIFRLAERQYSSGGKDVLKALLVSKLYDEGLIDGHKKVGACCSATNAFVAKDGTDMSDRKFSIKCNVNYDSVCCYQDSFKWSDGKRAWNYRSYDNDNDYDLSVTCMHVGYDDDDEHYDEYHDRYTHSELVDVYCDGHWTECAEDDLDDFSYVESYYNYEGLRRDSGYYHEDNVVYSYKDACYYLCDDVVNTRDDDEYTLRQDAYYSEFLDAWYSEEGEMLEDEKKYAKDNGYVYDEYNAEWIDEDDAVKVYNDDGFEYCAKYSAMRRARDREIIAILMDADDEDSLVYVTKDYYEQHFNTAA